MASHRRPKPANRTRVTVLTATAAAAVALSSQAANAAPKQSKDQVKQQVDQLYNQAEQASEAYDAAQEQQAKLQQQVNDLENQVARDQAQLNTLRDSLGNMASAQYRNGGIDPSVQLFLSSNPSDYLQRASTLEQMTGRQADMLKQLQEEQRQMDQERTEASAKLAQLNTTRQELAQRKADVQSKLAQAQQILNTLTKQEQAAINGGGSTQAPVTTSHASSQRAAAALAAAETRIGDEYVYGATGPSTFDCSGLTSWAYAQAGVSIPRTSQEQATIGAHLSMSQLQPGDLVFFYSDLHHVGIYAGNNTVLHAPHTGAQVRFETMSDMPFEFGVRV